MGWSMPGYIELRELGKGASGRVVLAEHQATGTKVAIKYLADHLSRDPEFVEAFRAEARILSEVEDPQIARLYEYVEAPEGSAIVMELVDGVALRAILREHGPTEPQSALVVLKGSLLGLAAAHERGIVHRDYKPENVLVDREGQSKLADFGIAARAGLIGAHAGTPSYMAPEQWAGAAASPSTDIYAATATFFECLTGHPPYRSPGDILGLRGKHEADPIPVDEVPEAVRGLVRRGLAKKSEHRPKDAATFLVELEAVAGAGYGPQWEEEGRGSLARRAALLLLLFPLAGAAAGGTGLAQTVLGWSKRSLNLVVAGGLALLLGLGGFFWYQKTQADPANTALVQTTVGPSPTVDALAITPSPSPTLEPTATPTAEPTATASPSASPSRSRPPSPSPSTSPTTSPTPPSNRVLSITLQQYPNTNSFCWWDEVEATCARYPTSRQQAPSSAPVAWTRQNGGAFNLSLRYVRVNPAGAEDMTPLVKPYPVPAGATKGTVYVPTDLARFLTTCSAGYRIKLTVTADLPNSPTSTAVYLDNLNAPC